MTKWKCRVCGNYISEFSPSISYCSKVCEGKNIGNDYTVNDLMDMMGITK